MILYIVVFYISHKSSVKTFLKRSINKYPNRARNFQVNNEFFFFLGKNVVENIKLNIFHQTKYDQLETINLVQVVF